MKKSAIVIGAGIAGIATSIRLTAKGYKVKVFEANAYAGGKLSEITIDGFRFDAGPSLFTMPQYVEELFTLMGEKIENHFEYITLENGCNYFYEDGTQFTTPTSKNELIKVLAKNLNEDEKAIEKYLAKSKKLFKITAPVFLQKSLHKLSTYLCKDGLYGIANIWQLDNFKTMNAKNKTWFKNAKTVQFFNRFATYNGSNPYQAPATLNIIPHLEYGYGTFFPKKGMISITDSLVALAKRHGVEFIFNQKIDEIIIENQQAIGISTNNEKYFANVVVSNMDVFPTYSKLLSKQRIPKQVKNVEPSSSALIFYWGINATFEALGLHNIFFSENYETEFDTIFKQKTIPNDSTIYINITSKYKTDDAPQGCENWFVMVNVPANNGQNWGELIQQKKTNIITKINRLLNTDLSQYIIAESILDPRAIEQKTSSYKGALYGSSSNKAMAAFFRHANFSSKIKNLYFCGGSVHPGGGIPLCLLSAKITSDIVE